MDDDETAVSPSSYSSGIFANFPLISALVAFFIAQTTKFFISWYKERRWDFKQLIGSGGMPSSHSATVSALAAAVGFQDGFSGSLFATSIVLACVVMYDALGVRLHAGRQAAVVLLVLHTFLQLSRVLNQIVYELPAEHPLSDSRPLRELLGHTPPQVFAGGILGVATAVITHLVKILNSQA